MAENKQRQKLIHLHTPDVKVPEGLLDLGEIAVQHNDTEPALYIQKNNKEIAKFIDDSAVDAKIKVEKTRAEGAEAALDDKIGTLSGSSHTHANKTVLDGITADKVAAWDAAETKAKTYADGLVKDEKGNVKFDAAGAAAQALADAKADAAKLYQVKGNYEASGAAATVKSEVIGTTGDTEDSETITGAKKYADSLNTVMDGRVDALEIDSHTHANKVELDKIAEGDKAKWDGAVSRLDNFLVGTGVAGVVDTLQDIKDWMDGEGVNATELTEAIAAEAKSRGDADTALGARITILEKIDHNAYVAADEATLASAKSYADGLAGNYDAAGSAAQALKDAKAYADGLDAAMDTRVDALEGDRHTHANKTVLDGITTQKVADWDAAKADAILSAKTYTDSVASGKADAVHTHAIADVTGLQGALDGKAASAHTHVIADVTGLQGALDGKDSKGAAAQALTDAKKYADGLVKDEEGNVKFDAVGAAAQALVDAKAYTNAQIAVLRIDCGIY